MADNGGDRNDTGSKDRATVALVDAKIDGLRELVRAEMGYLREKIEPITRIIFEHESLKSQAADHERRLELLEADKKADRDWKRVNLPSLVIAGSVALGSLLGVLSTLHVI